MKTKIRKIISCSLALWTIICFLPGLKKSYLCLIYFRGSRVGNEDYPAAACWDLALATAHSGTELLPLLSYEFQQASSEIQKNTIRDFSKHWRMPSRKKRLHSAVFLAPLHMEMWIQGVLLEVFTSWWQGCINPTVTQNHWSCFPFEI